MSSGPLIPTDTSSIFAVLNTPDFASARLAIVRPDNPPPGIAGFVFDLVEDDSSDLESDITDYYVEDNSAVQDQIALRPETITISGKVAEVVKTAAAIRKSYLGTENPLPLIPGVMPVLTISAEETQAQTLANQAADTNAVANTQTLWGYYNSALPQQPNQTKQSLVFGYFYQLWKGRQMFSVECPWGIMTNMAILSMSAKQGPDTRLVSDFTVTFKKIRVAQSISIYKFAGRAEIQNATEVNKGTAGQQLATGEVASYTAPYLPPTP